MDTVTTGARFMHRQTPRDVSFIHHCSGDSAMPGVTRYLMVPSSLRGALLCACTVAACSSGDKTIDKSADTTAAMTASPAPSAAPTDSMKGMSGMSGDKMGGMAMTGDADRDFLRMMSDHHKGLTEMAHGAKEMKLPVAADAKMLDTKQDAELDKMVTTLEKQYKDPYSPKIMPSNQAMIDALRGKTGADFQKTFYQNVVQHHQDAIKMIDDYLPKAKDASIKQMAEKMKADQTREIAQFEKKAAAIK
jgi:uncharacterized protein (DUF305 family)